MRLAPEQIICAQGDPADALFYIENGWVKVVVVSVNGKQAVTALRKAGDFLAMRCLIDERRGATAMTLTDCSLVRVTVAAVSRLLQEEPDFAEMFAIFLVRQLIYDQQSIVDQLTNSSEKRLARALLELADFSGNGNSGPIPTPINQTVLANMIGTTRPRVSFFMNKFKRNGFIEYNRNGDVTVRKSLLKVVVPDA